MTYITPYLPKIAELAAKDWMRFGKLAFVRSYERREGSCPNCAGSKKIYLLLIDKGPMQYAPGNRDTVLTWFEGDGIHKKGWYTIAQTLIYDCPECAKIVEEDKPGTLPPQDVIKRLDSMLGRKEQLDDRAI